MRYGVLTLLVVVGVLAGCVAVTPPTQEPGAPPVVRYINFKVYDPVYVAIDQGFCAERGIDVQIVGDAIAGPNAIQAVAAGQAEAGLSSVPALVNANAAGLPVQGVIDIQTTLQGQPLQRWFVLNDSPLQSLADVAGARYAVNIWRSSFHYTTLAALAEAGVDENLVDFQLLSFADQIPALMSGEIDVAGLIPPYQDFLLDEYGGQVRELWNDYDFYGEKHVSLIFLNRLWAQYNPVQADAFVACVRDAIEWTEDNQAEAAAIVSSYTGIPADAIGEYHFTPGGAVRMPDVQWWIDYLRTRGDLTADWVQPDDVATDKYNQ